MISELFLISTLLYLLYPLQTPLHPTYMYSWSYRPPYGTYIYLHVKCVHSYNVHDTCHSMYTYTYMYVCIFILIYECTTVQICWFIYFHSLPPKGTNSKPWRWRGNRNGPLKLARTHGFTARDVNLFELNKQTAGTNL